VFIERAALDHRISISDLEGRAREGLLLLVDELDADPGFLDDRLRLVGGLRRGLVFLRSSAWRSQGLVRAGTTATTSPRSTERSIAASTWSESLPFEGVVAPVRFS
jgi:hypothetical protein